MTANHIKPTDRIRLYFSQKTTSPTTFENETNSSRGDILLLLLLSNHTIRFNHLSNISMYQGLRTSFGKKEIDTFREMTRTAETPFQQDFLIGITVQIVGCILVAFGLCVEKLAIVRMEREKLSTSSSGQIRHEEKTKGEDRSSDITSGVEDKKETMATTRATATKGPTIQDSVWKLPTKGPTIQDSVWKRPMYLFGFGLFVLGNVCSAIALSVTSGISFSGKWNGP